MVIINGKMYGGDVTIVNGRVINGEPCDDSACKEFDETKKESAMVLIGLLLIAMSM